MSSDFFRQLDEKLNIICEDAEPNGDETTDSGELKKVSELLENISTFNKQRQKLNVPYLIQKGVLHITYPHGPEGWELDVEDPSDYSVITHYNVVGGGWPKDAPKHPKPKSYKDAEKEINTSKPNLGNSDLIYDHKYDQIIWSIKKLKLDPKKAFVK